MQTCFNPRRMSLLIGLLALVVGAAGCNVDAEAPGEPSEGDASQLRFHDGNYNDAVDGPHADHSGGALYSLTLPDAESVREYFEEGQTARIDIDKPFEQVGLRLNAESINGLSFRAKRADGQWTEANPVDIYFSEETLHNGLILLDEPAVSIELAGAEGLDFVHIDFFEEIIARDGLIRSGGPTVDAADLPGDDDELSTVQQAVAPSDLVTSRSGWNATNPGNVCGNVVDPYRMAIHHTAVPSSDGPDVHATVRSIQSYHMNNNGWCDIGYHFLVAQSGEILQGRSHSDRPGAHVGGHNSGNVGVALIGDYNSASPPNSQLNSAGAIVEWAAQTHSIPLDTSSIRGHQEYPGQTTSCPGNQGLNAIPEIISIADSGEAPPPSEPDEPEPDPGGCSGTPDDDADGSLFADFPEDATGAEEAGLLYQYGITTGCEADPLMFCPHCELTRDAFVTMLVRAAGIDTSDPPDDPTFDDVGPDSTFYAYVEAAYEAGITDGCTDDEFCARDEITRQAAAAMIHRAAGWPEEVPDDAPSFSDVDEDHRFFEEIETLKQRCVISGFEDGTFGPGDDMRRRHAAIMIARAFNLDDINPCAEPGGCTAHEKFGTEDSVFADYATHQPGYEETELLADRDIVQGCEDSPPMFCPQCETSRAAMIAMLVRAGELDTSSPPDEATFDDVPTDSTFFAYVEAAYDAGITQGCGDGVFCPTEPITRQAAASMVVNAAGWDKVSPDDPTFDDVDNDHFFYEEIETLADRCVTEGYPDGTFRPDVDVPRRTASIFVAQAFNIDGINPCAVDDDDDDGTDPPPGGNGDDDDNGSGSDGDDDSSESEGLDSAGCGGCATSPAAPTAVLVMVALVALLGLRRIPQTT